MHLPTVLIVDDHDIVRVGLESLVLASGSLRLIGSAATLAEALQRIARDRPDLVITDMALPDSKGLGTVRAVVEAQHGRRTLVVSMQDELLYGEQVLALGADGYLMKETAHAHAVPAAEAVLAGEQWVSPALKGRLLDRYLRRNRHSPGTGVESLSQRELEVLQALKGGKTTKEIAAELEISARTVDLHRASIKKKLRLRTGAELVAFAVSHF